MTTDTIGVLERYMGRTDETSSEITRGVGEIAQTRWILSTVAFRSRTYVGRPHLSFRWRSETMGP